MPSTNQGGLADLLLSDAANVVGGRAEVRQYDGGGAPERHEGEHYRGGHDKATSRRQWGILGPHVYRLYRLRTYCRQRWEDSHMRSRGVLGPGYNEYFMKPLSGSTTSCLGNVAPVHTLPAKVSPHLAGAHAAWKKRWSQL